MLGEVCLNDGQYARALEYYKKFLVRLDELDRIDLYGTHNIGLAYWLSGDKEKANQYFDIQIGYCKNALSGYTDTNGQLAAIYAFKGDREQAIAHLKEINKQTGMKVYMKNNLRKNNLYFSALQNDPEYQSIRAEILAKYEEEHERVRKWLEENDLL